MRIMGVFVLLLYGFLFLLLGVAVFLIGRNAVPVESIIKVLEDIYTMPNIALGVSFLGGVMVLLDLLLIQMGLSSGLDKKRTYTVKKANGEISIALFSPIDAIIKEIRRDLPEIVGIRHDVIIKGKRLNIDVKMEIKPGVNIPELVTQFQQKVTERIKVIVGIDMQIMVNVAIVKVTTTQDQKTSISDIPIPYRAMDV